VSGERRSRRWLLTAGIALACGRQDLDGTPDAPVSVAVAANFAEPLRAIARAFEASTGQAVRASSGSSGGLLAQIDHGAPFDVFLSADRARPKRLERAGLAVPGSRFTYALGRLVLHGPALTPGVDGATLLRRGRFEHLAMANPDIAPYGLAARQTLEHLGLWRRLAPKIVQGESVAQTHQFVTSGAAEVGFVALSQVRRSGAGRHWLVPRELHAPIEQDAVVLQRARGHAAAEAFVRFLAGDTAARIIEAAGYDPGRP
jgi:molybdate transport system substrate-binding protein